MPEKVIEKSFKEPSNSPAQDSQYWVQVGDLQVPVLPAGVVSIIQLRAGLADHASSVLGLLYPLIQA